MSEENIENISEEDTLLENLKLEADSLDISYTASATVKSLGEKIIAHQKKSATGVPQPVETVVTNPLKAEKDARVLASKKLKRVRITCNDSKISNRNSILRSVSNSEVSMTKVIPFNVPTHVPTLLLEYMRSEKYLSFGRKRMAGGVEVSDPRDVPTFVIEDLDPLTPKEFERIAIRQQAQSAVEA